MTLSDLSIKRPVFAWMLMIGLIVFGTISLKRMGVSYLPDVDFPVIMVSVTLEGAAPEVMETEVSDLIEDVVMGVEGMREVSSTSSLGKSLITIEFNLDRDLDAALQEVQTKIAEIQRSLPRGIDPPTFLKVNPEEQPFMWLAASGGKDKAELMRLVKDTLKNQYTSVPGVGQVFLGGYVEPNLRVWLDRQKMQARELTVADVTNAISQQHAEVPAGYIDTGKEELNVRVMGEASSVEQFENIIIQERQGGGMIWKKFRLKDIATIEDGLNDIRTVSRNLGAEAVGLGIKKIRGANSVEVADGVRKRTEQIKKTLPPGFDIKVAYDGTFFVREAVHELLFTLLLSAILTSIVCYFFLGSWSSTLNVLLAIPTSIIGAFTILYFANFTLNTFTLLGLSLAIGIVVDDAIMVLENIVRKNEEGLPRVQAAIVGAREITFAAMAATVAILAIFIPVIFMQGIVGKFFFQFGVTISATVILSLIEALTLAPMRTSQFLQTPKEWSQRPLARWMPPYWVDLGMEWATEKYRRVLAWMFDPDFSGRSPHTLLTRIYGVTMTVLIAVLAIALGFGLNYGLFWSILGLFNVPSIQIWSSALAAAHMVFWPLFLAARKHRLGLLKPFIGFFTGIYRHTLDRPVRVLTVASAIFLCSLFIGVFIKKEFVPSQDQGMVFIKMETPAGSSLKVTDEVSHRLEKWIQARPEVDNYYAAVGGFEGGEINVSMIFVSLHTLKKRPVAPGLKKPLTQQDFSTLINETFTPEKMPGLARLIVQDLSLSGFSASRGFPIEFTLRGPEWSELARISDEFTKRMKDSGMMTGIDTDYRIGQPEVHVIPNREKAAARGVDMRTIGDAVNAMIGGVRVGKYTRGGRRYDIRARLVEPDRTRPADIEKIWVRNEQGELISLAEVTDIVQKPTLLSINRKNRERAISVFANVAGQTSQNDALAAITKWGKELPAGYRIALTGNAETFQESMYFLLLTMFLGIFIAYMVLASQFNSFIHPLTVLLALPFSITGALLALWIGDRSLNMYSFIGLILLMGIVKKNSILLVDFTNARRAAGKHLREALLEACPIRLRPIIMTTMATIAAAIPPAMGVGPGAETRIPMALAIIGGVSVSTLLTLFVVPCAYSLMSRFESRRHETDLDAALKALGEK